MSKFVKYLLISLNILVILSLLSSYLSIYIDPRNFPVFQFFGLGFIFIYVINFLFLLFWIFIKRKKYLIIINAFIIIIGFGFFTDFFNINFTNNDVDANSFKIISYNVRQFDLYNWEQNKVNRNKYFDFLKKEDPDIVCFQEYYEDKTKTFITTDSIISFLKTKNYYFKDTYTSAGKYKFGIATFSKYPIIKSDFFEFENTSNIIIYSDLLINGDTIRVFNAHLQSIRFQPEDYKFIEKVESSIDSIVIDEAKPLIAKLRDAYQMRAIQANSLNTLIEMSAYKVIVCGDFNDTPISYTYHTVKGNLHDAFIEAGTGISKSYNGAFPSFRIDYVLYSDGIEAKDYNCPKIPLSDHFPVVTTLKIK
jgi:endonuclease/exonuclease/phosphatase family metal-dependent hydrolase